MMSFLQDYEILGCEPLHDIKNHIENLYSELPRHLNSTERKLIEETIAVSFEQKEIKRGVDYRKSLVKVVIALEGKINKDMYKILTLCEIQRILYAGEKERNAESVLRLHNMTFIHACLIREIIGSNVKTITERALWGKYSHALIYHSPIMYRIVSGKSANAEQEERIFNTLKQITRTTSNQQPDSTLLNNNIRLQVRDQFNLKTLTKEQHEIRKICQSLPKEKNTIIPFWIIDKYRDEWQGHLQRISDYLLERCWCLEHEEGIQFLDNEATSKSEKKYTILGHGT